MLGEGATTAAHVAFGLVGFAVVGLVAAVLPAQRHPEAQRLS